jgi:hypothetical protein
MDYSGEVRLGNLKAVSPDFIYGNPLDTYHAKQQTQ